MSDLLVRLNTRASLENATPEEKKYGTGIYVDFGSESDLYKEGSFKKVIESIVEQALVSENQAYRNIAEDVQGYFKERSPTRIFEVRVYDPKNDEYLRNIGDEESKVMTLEDYVKDYIAEKEMSNGSERKVMDYLDVVVNLKSPIGGR